MTKQEKAIIKALAGSLRGATSPNFHDGNMQDWVSHAKDMTAAIKVATNTLDGLCEDEEDEGLTL